MSDPASHRAPGGIRWLASRSGLVFLAFAGIAMLFLVYEHRLHVLGILPYLLLLACPLMHLFHHGGHGHGHGSGQGGREQAPPAREQP